jgi:hypothetical protein
MLHDGILRSQRAEGSAIFHEAHRGVSVSPDIDPFHDAA